MGLVIAGLRECWPCVGYRILDSRYFGVPQRRRRVFFVCGPTDEAISQVLALTEGCGGDSEAGSEERARVAASLTSGSHRAGVNEPGRRNEDDVNLVVGALPALDTPRGHGFAGFNGNQSVDAGHVVVGAIRHLGEGGSDDNEAQAGHLVVNALQWREGKGQDSDCTRPLVLGFAWQSGGDVRLAVKEEEGTLHANQVPAVVYSPDNLVGTLREHVRPGSNTDHAILAHALTGEGHDASEDGTGRGTPLTWSVQSQNANIKHANAIATDTARCLDGAGFTPNQGGTLVSAPMLVRRLTTLECERLQGFPDGWTCLCLPLEEWARDPEDAAEQCTCPDSPRYRAMGNAVTVNVAEFIGRRLIQVIERAR